MAVWLQCWWVWCGGHAGLALCCCELVLAVAAALVWKVARYTSAAPIYFTECDNFVDGGVLANNPTDYALTEIQDFLDTQGGDGKIACVVSVGCGIFSPRKIGSTDLPYIAVGRKTKLTDVPKRLRHMITLLTTAVSPTCH